MSIWDDKEGRKHVRIEAGGKRIHRKLPKGATASDAKRVEAELRSAILRMASQTAKQVNIPGDTSMAEILSIYVEHSETLRSADTSKYHVKRLGPWTVKYKASEAQEFSDHVIRDMSRKVADTKTRKMKAAYAPTTIN